jgi:D-alanyl-D-alanine dipeptidase
MRTFPNIFLYPPSLSVIISPVNKSRLPGLAVTFLLCLAVLFSLATLPANAQSSATATSSLLPGAQPPDAPTEWKQLVGIYTLKNTKDSVTIFERNRHLFWQDAHHQLDEIREQNGILRMTGDDGKPVILTATRDTQGNATGLTHLNDVYTRADAGSDPAHFYHITPARPVSEIRASALAAHPPAESGPFRKRDLVELVILDPAFHLDIRYATSNDFLGTPVYTQARAFMQRPAAEALVRVLHKLQPLGYGLLIHDAYRPWYVTKIFWDVTPPEGKIFVADPKKGSKHNRGCAVDLTLYDLVSGQPIEMPGLYDEMSPRSFPTFLGGTSLQRWHRDLLRRAMESEGFTVNEDEWWHFDYKDWKHYPILNIPFEKLSPDGTANSQ